MLLELDDPLLPAVGDNVRSDEHCFSSEGAVVQLGR